MLTNTPESLSLGMCSARCLLCQPPEQLRVATDTLCWKTCSWRFAVEDLYLEDTCTGRYPGKLLISSWKVASVGGTVSSPTFAPSHLLWGHNSRVAATNSHSCGTSWILNRATEPVTGGAAFEPTSCEKLNPWCIHASAVRTSMCNQKNLRSYCNILFHI